MSNKNQREFATIWDHSYFENSAFTSHWIWKKVQLNPNCYSKIWQSNKITANFQIFEKKNVENFVTLKKKKKKVTYIYLPV